MHDPRSGPALPDATLDRREFLRLLGAGVALAGLGGCVEPPRERILPYTIQPPEVTPGVPRFYATAMTLDGYATGLLVASREGRPVKVEGNPDHPASLGAAGVFEQASVLQLYDAARTRLLSAKRRPVDWSDFVGAFGASPAGSRPAAPRAALRFLLEPTSSPLSAYLIDRIRQRYPAAGFSFWTPFGSTSVWEGTRIAFGRPLEPRYAFGEADVVVAADADFLAAGPFHLRYARHFAERRRPEAAGREMSRLYVAESGYSVTGGMADARLRVRGGEVVEVLAALLAEITAGTADGVRFVPEGMRGALARLAARAPGGEWVRAAARDLRAHRGRGLVLAGREQPPLAHALAHAIDAALGNLGRTVSFALSPVLDAGAPTHALEPLVAELNGGQVGTLVILGGNPVYAAPADLELAEAIRRAPATIYLGLYDNETAAACDWLVPARHYLESWGDTRACDGTTSIVQPLIAPLWGGRTADEVLAVFGGLAGRDLHDLLRESWGERVGASRLEEMWAAALQSGIAAGTETPPVEVAPRWDALVPGLGGMAGAPERIAAPAGGGAAGGGPAPADALELRFVPSAAVYDGRFANNPWLQELPDPVTKLTWGNAALLGPRSARRLGVRTGDVVEIERGGRSLRIRALVLPGHADGVVTLPVGYGRRGSEPVARGVGVDAFAIRTSEAPYVAPGATLRQVPEAEDAALAPLAATQTHDTQEERPIALSATLAAYRADPDFTRRERGRTLSLYRPFEYSGDQWAMTIDLARCTGCSACVVACQAENNVPVVGAEGVRRGREMHWLRIDRYFSGELEAPAMITQPMLCQHCEKAPCEYVCPVNATVHSPDGLNEMIYNRCIGTRFCSNNCPYKVRRFNWFDYTSQTPEPERMQFNPDVTVRARGVMEKCTYCVQRIRRAEIGARIEGREIGDGEVRTACQQACPTRAIVFGSLGDADSEVSRTRRVPRIYAVLHELGTEPRTRYLARITNPPPAGAPG